MFIYVKKMLPDACREVALSIEHAKPGKQQTLSQHTPQRSIWMTQKTFGPANSPPFDRSSKIL